MFFLILLLYVSEIASQKGNDSCFIHIYLSHLLEEYGKHLARIGRTLFEGMSKNLSLDPSDSKSNLSESTGLVRVYRYPQWPTKSKNQNKSAWGMDVHTDSSVLSILNQDEVGGLEVLKDNHWCTVKPIPNTLVVNLGDMMQVNYSRCPLFMR